MRRPVKVTLPDGRTWPRNRYVYGHWTLASLWHDFAFELPDVWLVAS